MAHEDESEGRRPADGRLGALARQGVDREREAQADEGDAATAAWRKAVQEARDAGLGTGTGEALDDGWVMVEEHTDAGEQPDADGDVGAEPTIEITAGQRRDIATAVGAPVAAKYERRLANGARAYRAGRYEDCRKVMTPLAERVPGSPAVRELLGLALYRLGRWKAAARELEAFIDLTGTTEQHPVLADCYRALERYSQVERLWRELRDASPSAALVTEGRIVAAGSEADQGQLTAALKTLGHPGWKVPRRPKAHHLRRAYALADLYERSGDIPRARRLFERISGADAGFADVPRRLRALS